MSSPMDELCAGLVEAISNELGCPVAAVELAVAVTTAGWKVRRVKFPNTRQHPAEDTGYGHVLEATLPFVPENDIERADREARDAARHWAFSMSCPDWDDWDAADEVGPPPERVNINEFLEQGHWWRSRISPDSPETEAIRLYPTGRSDDPYPHMTHSHRMALLAFLRRNAGKYKMREDWVYSSVPGPNGDMASLAFEEECDRQWATSAAEWIEQQTLIRALVWWTTPYAESPLTWRPVNYETPEGEPIMVRFVADSDETPTLAMRTMQYGWTDPYYAPLDADPVEWRELRLDELSPTWQPMRDAPRTGRAFVARRIDFEDEEIILRWNAREYRWETVESPHRPYDTSELSGWRELCPGEQFTAHAVGVCDPDDCTECEPR